MLSAAPGVLLAAEIAPGLEGEPDLAGVLKELRARGGTPEIVASDAIDMKNVGAFVFTPVAEKVMAKDVKRPRRAA